MTTVYVLTGRDRNGGVKRPVRRYYATEQAAHAALPHLVLNERLGQPVTVEAYDVEGDPGEACGCEPDRALCTYAVTWHLRCARAEGDAQRYDELRAALREALGPWHADRNAVPDAALVEYVTDAVRAAERDPAEGDVEHERRRAAVVEAVEALVAMWDRQPVPVAAKEARALRAAVEALREYTPAEVAAPAADEPAPPVGPSARDELHDLAPLPWTIRGGEFLVDAEGRDVFETSTGLDHDQWRRAALLLAAVVNGPDGTADETVAQRAANDLRHRVERDVLDAARAWRGTGTSGPATSRLVVALDRLAALDKVTDKGGTVT